MNPLMRKRILGGTLVLVLGAGLLQFLNWLGNDPDLLPGDSKGMVAAVEYLPRGSQIVVFQADGTKIVLKHVDGTKDIDPLWRTDGQRLYFTSDREDEALHIFRWRPGNDFVERRSVGKTSRSTPAFGPAGDPKANKTALITIRGQVREYNPTTGASYVLLPTDVAAGPDSGNDNEGAASHMTGAYGDLGVSFLKARWGLDRRYIIATMQRHEGEVLVVQDMQPKVINGKERVPPPIPVVSGNHVSFDVSKEGIVVVAVEGFRWTLPENESGEVPPDILEASIPEEFRKGGVITTPYVNSLFSFDPNNTSEGAKMLFASQDNSIAFNTPSISPQGDKVAFVVGTTTAADQFEPDALQTATLPFSPDGKLIEIIKGQVSDPAWNADSDMVYFAQSENGKKAIYAVASGGGERKKISTGEGSFGMPMPSPQRP